MKKTQILKGILGICLVFMVSLLTACAMLGFASVSTSDSREGGGSSAAASDRIAAGTYTFYPRLRASRGGVDVNAYLDRVEVKGNNMTFYLTNEAISGGGNPAGEWQHSWRINGDQFIVKDLDRPSRTWVRTNHGSDEATGGMFLTYEGVTGRRLSLTSLADNPNMVFDEIIIGEPDPALDIPALRNGTYTFYPRIQAIRSGAEVDAYIDRITVRGEFVNIYLTNVPVGRGGAPAGEWRNSWRINGNRFYLQDLDRPQRTWIRINHGDDDVTGGMFLTYQGVNASRFSLTSREDNPNMIFEEIVLSNPD